jgi:hypothetical protein
MWPVARKTLKSSARFENQPEQQKWRYFTIHQKMP